MTFKYCFLVSLSFLCVLTSSGSLMASQNEENKEKQWIALQESFKQEIERLKERITNLNTLIKNKETDLEALKADNQNQSLQINLYKEEVQALQETLTTKRKEYTNQLKELQDGESRNSTQHLLSAKDEEISALEKEKEQLQKEYDMIVIKNENLKDQVIAKEEQIQATLTNATKEINNAKKVTNNTIQQQNKEIERLQKELKDWNDFVARRLEDREKDSIDDENSQELDNAPDEPEDPLVRRKKTMDNNVSFNLHDMGYGVHDMGYGGTPKHRKNSTLRSFMPSSTLVEANEDRSDVSEEDSPQGSIKEVHGETPNEENPSHEKIIIFLSVMLCFSVVTNLRYFIQGRKTIFTRENKPTNSAGAQSIFAGAKPEYIDIVIPI